MITARRHSLRSLAECTDKESAVTYLEMLAIHTKDTVLAGLARTWKHLTTHVDDTHTVRTYGPVQSTRLGLRERQIVGRINERLTHMHTSVGTIPSTL
jgi:hypothetical protein